MKISVHQLRTIIAEELNQLKLGVSSPQRTYDKINCTCQDCGETWPSAAGTYKGHLAQEQCPDCGSTNVVSRPSRLGRPKREKMTPKSTSRVAKNLLASLSDNVA